MYPPDFMCLFYLFSNRINQVAELQHYGISSYYLISMDLINKEAFVQAKNKHEENGMMQQLSNAKNYIKFFSSTYYIISIYLSIYLYT